VTDFSLGAMRYNRINHINPRKIAEINLFLQISAILLIVIFSP